MEKEFKTYLLDQNLSKNTITSYLLRTSAVRRKIRQAHKAKLAGLQGLFD